MFICRTKPSALRSAFEPGQAVFCCAFERAFVWDHKKRPSLTPFGRADFPGMGSRRDIDAFGIANPARKDAGLLVTLAPGNCTEQVRGVGGSTALVEQHEVPYG